MDDSKPQDPQNSSNAGDNPMGSAGAGQPTPPAGGNTGGTPPPPPPPPPPSGAGAPPPPPAEPIPTDYQFGDISGKLDIKVKIPEHSLKFDENLFLQLLAGSISLTIDEKQRIIESIPKLSQFQIDELIKILQEEKRKFRELNEKHLAQLKKLEEKHAKDWEELEMKAQEQKKSDEDQQKADDIKKQLGL